MDNTYCSICLEICILPYQNTCVHGNIMNNSCYSCINKWYEFNKKNKKKTLSWNGCGCKFDLNKPFCELFKSNTKLEKKCELLKKPKCKNCSLEFSSSDELKRHLFGNLKVSDKFKKCPYEKISCKYCNIVLIRKDINKHIQTKHTDIKITKNEISIADKIKNHILFERDHRNEITQKIDDLLINIK